MKKVLPTKHLLYTLFMCLLCCASLPALAIGDDSNEGGDPPVSPPPTLPYSAKAVAYQSFAGSLEIIFLEGAEIVEVEVVSPDGITTIVAVDSVNASSHLQMDTRRWKRGNHTLRLKVNGRLVSVSSVQLE